MSSVSSQFILRPTTPADVTTLFRLIQLKAEYENTSHTVTGDAATLEADMFGDRSYVEAILAEYSGQVVGFATFFPTYSTYLTRVGIHLDDLFVVGEYRGQGIGKALLSAVAQLAVTRGCGRLGWNVADWNKPAIAFYSRMGASILEDLRTCRVAGESLTNLASLYDGSPCN